MSHGATHTQFLMHPDSQKAVDTVVDDIVKALVRAGLSNCCTCNTKQPPNISTPCGNGTLCCTVLR